MLTPALACVRAHPAIAAIADRLMAPEPAWPAPTIDPERGAIRQAAVAVVFRLGADGDPELLFVARAEYPGDPWSAHVAFPGGRVEPSDTSAVETATRETFEEIGLELRAVGAVLGELPLVTPRAIRLPAIQVRPVVVIVASHPALVPGPEVQAAFWLPLRALATPECWRPVEVDAGGTKLTVSAFTHGEYVIWGLTARILHSLLFNEKP